ncbi:MAG: hypothetical protein GY886_09810, partial [Gammaproteobacteria bacterium]|nr:hypothetical protein [Gammaproteobacteria bacterium]
MMNLPEGFVIDEQSSAAMDLPEGFVIESSESVTQPVQQKRNSDLPAAGDGLPFPQKPEKIEPERGIGERIIGAGETALAALTGGTTGMLSGAAGGALGAIKNLMGQLTMEEAQQLQQEWAGKGTYAPRTEAGQEYTETIGELTESLPPITGAATPRVRVGKTPDAPTKTGDVIRAERFSQETGAPLMESDINEPTTFAGKAVRGISEKVPFLGTGEQRAKQQEARQGVITDYLQKFDTVTDDDLYRSLVGSENKRKQYLGKAYKGIEDKMQDSKVLPNKTVETIDNEITRLTGEGRIVDETLVADLNKLKEQLSSGEVDYKTMRENRTYVREALKSEKSKTMSDRVIDRVYSSMTDDIQDAVKSNLGDKEANKLKQIDTETAKGYNEIKKTKLKNVLNKGDVKPEEVTKMLLSNDASENRKLYNSLDRKGRKNAQAVLVQELGKAFEQNESPEKFLQKANKLDKQFEMFFRGDDKETFKDLVSYLNQTREAGRAGVYNQNGQQLMSLISLAPVADVAATGGMATAGAVSMGLLGRALENRQFRKALRD